MALFGYQTTLTPPPKPRAPESPYTVNARVRAAQGAANAPTTQTRQPNLTPAGNFTGQTTVPDQALPKPAPAPKAAPPPAAPPHAAPTGPPSPAPGPGPTPAAWDPTLDPVYQQIQNDAAKNLANRQTDVTAQERQLAIGLGDPTWAAAVLGENDPALAGVSNAPTALTTLGRLARDYQASQLSADEKLGDQNLFFSGARVGQQRNLAYTHTRDVSDAEAKAQAQYHTLEQQRLADEDTYNKALEDALAQAYTRRLAEPIRQPNAAGGTEPIRQPNAAGGTEPSGGGSSLPGVDTAIATAIRNAQASAAQKTAAKKTGKAIKLPSGLRGVL